MMMMMMDSIVDAGFARHFHELPAEIGESKSMKIMPHCHSHCHWESCSCHLAATALEKPRMQPMRIETTAVKHMEEHSVGSNSKDAEEEIVAAAAAESVAVAEPAVVEELILQLQLQVKQAEAHFACEVVVPIDSGPDQIEDAAAAAAAAAAAQPGLERELIHFDSYFDQ